jgi:glycosyltransferase involved in cell wall biosynthesis
MNIAIVTHNVLYGDGQGRVNYEIAKFAINRGHHVTLVACRVAPDLLASDRVTFVRAAPPNLPLPVKSLLFALQSSRWLMANRAKLDVVHVNGWVTFADADINAVHFVHTAWLRSPVHTSRVRRGVYGFAQYLYTSLNAKLEAFAFRKAKVLVAVSQQVRRELIQLGTPEEKVRVVFNGVDLQAFYPGDVDRAALGLPRDVVLALFVGDIRNSRKNLDTVLEAIALIPDIHLAVVGRVEGSPYPQLAKELGVSGRVHFLDFRSDVADIMRASDLFVFPSRYEACSLALLEALSSGLPIVTAKTTGGAEIVTSACGVAISNADNVGELVSAITELASSTSLRRRMSTAARLTAEEHAWEQVAGIYLGLYEEYSSAGRAQHELSEVPQ